MVLQSHSIQVSLDEEDRVWLFLHSGSRGVGNRLTSKHIKVAKDLARKWWIPLADPDLAYLVEDTDEFGPTCAICAGPSTSRC